MNSIIKSKLADLPKTPGVYFHKDKNNKIIYVGKAAVLRNRVRQYFQSSRHHDTKTKLLVSDITDIDWIEVETELDALFLEAELIKRYKPKYNIDLRDDKSQSYIRIDSQNAHPTVSFSRRPLDDGAEYFGPFTSVIQLRQALKLLRKIFPFDYKKPTSKNKKVNLDYHIGLSPGLEEGRTSIKEYRENLGYLKRYLKGQRSDLIKQFEKEMKQAAKNQQFEQAAILRNRVYSLKVLRKQVVFSKEEFMDISKDQALSGLQQLLGLKEIPRRIEGYDISHQSGTNNVASMVVFTNGLPDKTQYRKFKMRLKGNDDFAHMREVMGRRFAPRNAASWPKPDLILIDGGKGQLSSAKQVLSDKKINIPAIGLAKRYETIIVEKDTQFEEIRLPKDSHVIKLLQRVRDESHRFAVSYHSSLKVKSQTSNFLESIDGVGAKTRQKLLRSFGSLKAVNEASEQDLAAVVGPDKAKKISKGSISDR